MTTSAAEEHGRHGLARIAALAGRWEGDEFVHPTKEAPKGVHGRGRLAFTVGLAGRAVFEDYEHWQGRQAMLVGHGVFGYDAQDGAVTFDWFDSSGARPGAGARGLWNGDELVLEETGPGRIRRTLHVTPEGAIEFRLGVGPLAARVQPIVEGRYLRK